MQDLGAQKLGLHLKQLREERKMTLGAVETLSAEHGERINKSYLFRVEKGKTVPTLTRLHILSRVYRVRLSSLVDRVDPPRAPAKQEDDPPIDIEHLSFEDLRTKGLDAEAVGDFSRSVSFFQAACRRAVLENSSEDRIVLAATARHDLAIALRNSGRSDLAREEAEAVFEEPRLPEPLRNKIQLNLAIIYRRLGHATLAREFLLGLLSREDRLATDLLAMAHHEMGTHLRELRPAEATKHYKAALAIQKKKGCYLEVCGLLVNIGLAQMNAGTLNLSLRSLGEALTIGRTHQFRYPVAVAQSAIGKNLLLSGDAERARAAFREANELARHGDYYDLLFFNHYYLRSIAEGEGDRQAVRAEEATLKFFAKFVHEPSQELEAFRKETK